MEKMQFYENAVEVENYKDKICQKSDGEICIDQPLEYIIEAAKENPKTKRCKHDIKEGKIDMKYAFMNPIQDYILKKAIFPTMPMKLSDIIKNYARAVQVITAGDSAYTINENSIETRLINGATFQNIKDLPLTIENADKGEVDEAKWIPLNDFIYYKWAFEHDKLISIFCRPPS